SSILHVVVAFPSAFLSIVCALALWMPMALHLTIAYGVPPSNLLMLLSFCSMLDGMTTLSGTRPNPIVAGFRAKESGTGFEMFDFSPVGVAVAVAGVAFVVLLGRFLVPVRARAGIEGFETGAYLPETRVPEKSKLDG